MGWWTEHVVPRMVDISLSQRPVIVRHTYLGPGPAKPFGYLSWGRAAQI